MKAVNKGLFHDTGLHATTLTTKNLLKQIQYTPEKLELPPLEARDEVSSAFVRYRARRQAKHGKKRAKKSERVSKEPFGRSGNNNSSSSSLSSGSSSDSSIGSEVVYESATGDDPKMRRMRALEGYVMPLSFDVPPAVSPDSLLHRMGHAQAVRLNQKQDKKAAKGRRKEKRKIAKRAV